MASSAVSSVLYLRDTRLRIAGKNCDQYVEAMSKVFDGLRGELVSIICAKLSTKDHVVLRLRTLLTGGDRPRGHESCGCVPQIRFREELTPSIKDRGSSSKEPAATAVTIRG